MIGKYVKSGEIKFFIVFVFFLLFFFFREIFTSVTFYARDISQYYRPMEWLASESLQRGIFPFWNPYVSCGQPFFAFLQHGLLYPLNLLTILFPFEYGFKYNIIIHFLLGGIFLYFLCRRMKLGVYASAGAMVIFCFSGIFVSLLNILTTLRSYIWWPLLYLFFWQIMERKACLFWTIMTALIPALQFFSGQPEITYMSFIAAMLFFLASHDFRHWKFILQKSVLVLLLTMLFIAIEFIPFSEVVYYSSRFAAQAQKNSLFWDLAPRELLHTTRMGGAYQQEWLKSIYLGIPPVFFSLMGLFFGLISRRRITLSLVGVGGFFLFCAFGDYTPFFKLISIVFPGLHLIRYQIKFILGSFFIFSLLSGMGLQFFFSKKYGRSFFVRLSVLILLLGQSIIVTAGLEKTVPSSFFKEKGELNAIFGSGQPGRYAFSPTTLRVITETKKEVLFKSLRDNVEAQSKLELLPNSAMVRHWYLFQGYESLQLSTFSQFLSTFNDRANFTVESLLQAAGVKYLISFWDIPFKDWHLRKEGIWKVYENKNALPRAFVLKNNYLSVAELYKGERIDWNEIISKDAAIEFLQYDLNSMVIHARTGKKGGLIVNDVYYPGWQAYVDGVKTKIFPALGVFRGVSIFPGEHIIRFVYMPSYFIIGLAMTMIIFLWCIFRGGAFASCEFRKVK